MKEIIKEIIEFDLDEGRMDYLDDMIDVFSKDGCEMVDILFDRFLKKYYVPTDDPYAELLPILRETGIDAATVSTPTVAATFDKMLHHLTYMLMIWGVQALVLLIGLFCLILFGARLYCDNYRDRIACRLIEGHSLLSCIRTHLVLTVLYYGAVAAGLLLLKLAIELDYNILLGTLLAELLITLLACGSIARKNLYQIVKGAEA